MTKLFQLLATALACSLSACGGGQNGVTVDTGSGDCEYRVEDPCVNEDNLAQCRELSLRCPGQMQVMETCPLQFSCPQTPAHESSASPPAEDSGTIILGDIDISSPCDVEPPEQWAEDRPADYQVSEAVTEGEFRWSGLRLRPRQHECPDRTAPPGFVRLLAGLRSAFETCASEASGRPVGGARLLLTIEESGASRVTLLEAHSRLRATGVTTCFTAALQRRYPPPLRGTMRYELSVELTP